ncbi:rho GTPase activator [Aspergillus sclerotialis]|uniref:Rho GTPase activator n=1 Tax=Aspergillus sclerotialis TaxID=2070753 RepID=A0A3A2ZM35_9EURO|nr:rho GTPase activator [Aspergillus sclerotialis]
MVTGKSQPPDPLPLPPSAARSDTIPMSPPSKRDLTSWWRQFKRGARKDDAKEKPQGIFGVPLNVSIKYANVAISLTNDNGESFIYGYVPIVVAKCGVFLKEKATDVEGIFRLNGSAKRIKDLQEIFDSPERYGKGLDWNGYTVHDAANVLRRYLNQLPEPIVPLEFYERFREPLRIYQTAQANGETVDESFDHPKAVASYQQLIRELPPLNKQLLLYILDLLAVFASKSEQNRMPSANLAAIFQPGMLSHPQHYMSPDEYKLSQDVLIFLIENQDNFLFGMNGTAADEQTVKEVEAGLAPRPTVYSTSIRRSASSASNGRESYRKYDGLRRNVSVSSKNSRNSNHASPGTPPSFNGVGVHRSNTLPSKMSPAIPPSRLARGPDSAGLAPPARHSRSASRTPPPLEENIQTPTQELPVAPGTGVVYAHSSTHGPVPRRAGRPPTNEKPRMEDLPTSPSPEPVTTPPKERRITSFFARSPPQTPEQKEVRQPNRLKKRRIPGSTSESAQSSSLSLQGGVTDSSVNPASHSSQAPSLANEAGGATPKPHITSNPDDEPTPQVSRDTKKEMGENGGTDNALRPPTSRTPSMNSHSSFTDHSELEQANEVSRAERKDHRRSWRFPRSSKRSSEQLGLGLESPPLIATNVGAERSTSSIGSWHQSTRSSPSDLQQPDISGQLLSLDAEVNNNGSKESTQGSDERKSLFGKFKAKVAQVREGWESDREKSKSPVQMEAGRSSRTMSPIGRDSMASRTMSPPANDNMNGRPAPIDIPKDTKDQSTPVSPNTDSGPPPAIPEEPRTPEKRVSTIRESPRSAEHGAQSTDQSAEQTSDAPNDVPKDIPQGAPKADEAAANLENPATVSEHSDKPVDNQVNEPKTE